MRTALTTAALFVAAAAVPFAVAGPVFRTDFESGNAFDANAYDGSSDGNVRFERDVAGGVGRLVATVDGDGLGEGGWFNGASQAWVRLELGEVQPQQVRLRADVAAGQGGPTGPVMLTLKDETTGATWTFRGNAGGEFTSLGGTLDQATADQPAPLTAAGDYSILVAFADAPWGGWSGEAGAENVIRFDNVEIEVTDAEPAAVDAAEFTQIAPAKEMPTYGDWHQSRLGGGGYWMGVVPTSDSSVFYTFSDVGGAWRSDDGGLSWRSLNQDVGDRDPGSYVRSLSVDPRDPDTLLMASGSQWYEIGGLYRSTDGGTTWQQVVTAPVMGNEEGRMGGTSIARSPADPNRLVFAHAQGVRVSDDNGQTWTLVGEGKFGDLFPSIVAFDATDPNRVWVGGQDGENFIGGWSADGPTTFRGGLWRSDDAGQTWQQLGEDNVVELAQLPGDDAVYAVFNYNSLRRSDDGGETWDDLNAGLPSNGTDTSVIGHGRMQSLAAGPDFLITANGQGEIFRLPAGGNRWQAVETEHITDGNRWYGHIPGEETEPGAHQGWVHYGKSASSLMIDPTNADRWFMTDWYAVWRSEDAGRSWALSIDGLENTVSHDMAGQPGMPGVVHWGMGDNGYLRSSDGGQSFAKIDFPAGGSNVKDFGQSPAMPERLYATTNVRPGEWEAAQLAVSDDAGQTWRNPAMAGLPGDMGEQRRMNSVTVDPTDANRILVGVTGDPTAEGGVYESRDAGESFSKLGSGLQGNEWGTYFQVNVWAVGNELALSGDGSAIAFSQDGEFVHRLDGDEWQPIARDFGGQPYEVAADPETPGRFYLAVVDGGTWRTDDGGQSWQKIHDASSYYLAISNGRLAIGHETGVVVSHDGGRTWSEVAEDLPVRRRPIPTFAGNRLHVGTHNMGTFWRELPPQ
jgi:photosystem II stability/assembly factor-like uncharacterized protein